MAKKSVLGRGLGTLLADADKVGNTALNMIQEIPIAQIIANPNQPRTTFDDESLSELAQSIKELGIVQPLTVRKLGDKFQIIAGERRFRAAKLAGLAEVPAYIRDVDDEQVLELALVENIQREDLDPIEIAISYQRLMEECSLTQETLSDRVGKKRATVANYLRLLKLPAEIQLGLREHLLQMGHARALLSIADYDQQVQIYDKILKEGLSVRKVEELAKEANKTEKKPVTKPQKNNDYKALENHLESHFKAKVQLQRSRNGKGKITIAFTSDTDLERIIGLLDQTK
ncbi:chromosome segregation DNA-binding protein [Balneicella halophila]|uniref:Chromosome segregation DNA-binding protein n=1 Tax=Balneicella halophila TaxID=1537566 RepID=A0A7L4UPU1_BALHA|nr:ParB/RepB/Spo0J family partition protein [Balneicella halophila]PVX50063.1 chromosome segregation DNA-binding protein [Balneicella halophila]